MKKLILEMNDMMILKNKNNMQSVSSSQTVFIASPKPINQCPNKCSNPSLKCLCLSLILAQTNTSLNGVMKLTTGKLPERPNFMGPLKLVSAVFYHIFIFSPNDSPLKTMKIFFYFI